MSKSAIHEIVSVQCTYLLVYWKGVDISNYFYKKKTKYKDYANVFLSNGFPKFSGSDMLGVLLSVGWVLSIPICCLSCVIQFY